MGSNQFLGKSFKYNTLFTMNNQVRMSPLYNRQKLPSVIINDNRTIFNSGGGFGFGYQPMMPMMPMYGYGLYTPPRGFGGFMMGLMDGLTGNNWMGMSLLNSTALMPGGLLNRTAYTQTTQGGEAEDKELAQLKQLLGAKITSLVRRDGKFDCQTKDGEILTGKTYEELAEALTTKNGTAKKDNVDKKKPKEQTQAVEDDNNDTVEEEVDTNAAEEDEKIVADATETSKLEDGDLEELKDKNVKFVRDYENKTQIDGIEDDSIGEIIAKDGDVPAHPKDITVNGHIYSYKGVAPNGDLLYKSTVADNDGGYRFAGDTYRLRVTGEGEERQLVLVQCEDNMKFNEDGDIDDDGEYTNGAGTYDKTKV